MKSTCSILIVAFASALCAQAVPTSTFVRANLDRSLTNYLTQTNGVNVAADPAITAKCFSIYLPMLNEVATNFSVNYQACTTTASKRTTDLKQSAANNKADFISMTSDMCSIFTTCNTDTDVLTFFNCYSTATAGDVSTVYNLSNKASTAANTLSQGLKTIQEDQQQCSTETERTYVADTAATYSKLDNCLANGPDSTETTEAAETTTEASEISEPTEAGDEPTTTDAATTTTTVAAAA